MNDHKKQCSVNPETLKGSDKMNIQSKQGPAGLVVIRGGKCKTNAMQEQERQKLIEFAQSYNPRKMNSADMCQEDYPDPWLLDQVRNMESWLYMNFFTEDNLEDASELTQEDFYNWADTQLPLSDEDLEFWIDFCGFSAALDSTAGPQDEDWYYYDFCH